VDANYIKAIIEEFEKEGCVAQYVNGKISITGELNGTITAQVDGRHKDGICFARRVGHVCGIVRKAWSTFEAAGPAPEDAEIPLSATFTKSRGVWAVKVTGTGHEMARTVTVGKRDGTTSEVVCTRRIEAGDGFSVFEFREAREPRAQVQGTCDECGRPARGLVEVVDASNIAGHCCQRCAAQPASSRSFA
jgi:hypothetical protein